MTSGNITVSPAAANRLVLQQSPTTGTAGQALSPSVQVAVEDAFGNVVTSNTSTVKIAVGSGPGSLTAGSTTSVAAVSGVATFSNLVLDTAGTYTLKATDGALTSVASGNITVSPAAASQLVIPDDVHDRDRRPGAESFRAGGCRRCLRQRGDQQHVDRRDRRRQRTGRIDRWKHDQRDSGQRRGDVQQSGSRHDGDLHAQSDGRFADQRHLRQYHGQRGRRQPVGPAAVADDRELPGLR